MEDQSSGTGGGKKWLNSRYILKEKPRGLAGRLSVRYKRKTGVKDDIKVFVMSS